MCSIYKYTEVERGELLLLCIIVNQTKIGYLLVSILMLLFNLQSLIWLRQLILMELIL